MVAVELREKAKQYQVVLTYDLEDPPGWLVDVPAFPQIVTSGDTPEEALANGYEAIALALDWCVTHSRPFPAIDAQVAA